MWEKHRLGDALKLEYGKPLEKTLRKEAGKYKAYGANGPLCNTDEAYYDEPSIIVGRKGSAGEITLVREPFWPLDVTYFVTYDKKKYDLDFLYYCLSMLNLPSMARGVKPGINRNEVYALEVFFPPLEEQKRVVAILDEAFARIDQAIANTEQNIQNAYELLLSEKAALFDKIKQRGNLLPIESVCLEIFAGGDAPKENLSDTKTDKYNIPIIANAVKDNGLYGYTDLVRVTKPSVTVAARGSGTGHTEVRPYPFYPIVRLIVLTPDTKRMNVDFFMYAVQDLEILRSGSAIPQLTVPMMKGYYVPVPEIQEQERIVEILNNLTELCRELESSYQQKLAALQELKQSLLQKAFAGELTSDLSEAA